MKVFFNAAFIQVLFNAYVLWRIWHMLPDKKQFRIPTGILFGIEFVIYIVGYFFYEQLSVEILRPILRIGCSWAVFTAYLTMFLLVYDLILWIGKKKNKEWRLKMKSVKTHRRFLVISCIIITGAMIKGNYNFWHPTVIEKEIIISKKTPNINNLRVVVVSDLHTGYLINKKVLKMYVDKILEQKPDMILIVGDIIDYNLRPLQDEHMEKEFRRLKAPYGVFAVTGNHEYRLDWQKKIDWLENKAGLTLLRDSVVKVANSFYVIGREDDYAPSRMTLPDLMTKYNVDKSLPTIVMNHEPNKLQEESDANIDVAVFGHTHDGQLFPYNLVIKAVFEVGQGYKKKDNTNIYVTSGLGLAGPQYRIGTISELTVLNLKFN